MPDPDLWPDPVTLEAGDEDEAVAPDYLNDGYPDPREIDNSDGHLEASDYFERHPDANP